MESKRLPGPLVQLYSLLMGLFIACAEVGAFPTVICQPWCVSSARAPPACRTGGVGLTGSNLRSL